MKASDLLLLKTKIFASSRPDGFIPLIPFIPVKMPLNFSIGFNKAV